MKWTLSKGYKIRTKLVKNIRSDNSLREWQIVLENMENIIMNRYEEV